MARRCRARLAPRSCALASFAFHRLHVAGAGAVASPGAFALFAFGTAALVYLATRRPRPPVLEALLVGLAVSLLVNDSPSEIAFFGALSGLALWAWCRSNAYAAAASANESRAMT